MIVSSELFLTTTAVDVEELAVAGNPQLSIPGPWMWAYLQTLLLYGIS